MRVQKWDKEQETFERHPVFAVVVAEGWEFTQGQNKQKNGNAREGREERAHRWRGRSRNLFPNES